MKTLFFLSCIVTVVLGLAPNRVVQRDLLPAQGHVVQEDSQPLVVKRTEFWQIEQDTNTEWVPLVQEKEAEVPLVQEKEAEVPLVQEKEAEVPLVQEKEAEVPLVQEKEAEVPLVQEEEAEVPLVQEEEAEVPLVQEKEAEVPLVQEKEAEVPLVQEEEAEVPLVQEEEAEVPLVQEEEAVVPLVQEEEKEAVPVMDPGLDMEPAAELQPEEEVDPEMEVEGELERSEVEEGPILEEESLGVEEPMMELEPLEEDSLVGQDLTSDELQQSVFQYEVEQQPIMELEPLPEEGLGMERKPYVMDEEPIMELEPLPEEGLGMDSEPHVIMGEEPIMELEPFGGHPVMEYNDIMVEEPRMELEPEIHKVPYSATGRHSVMVEEPVMELEPLAGEESHPSPMKRGTPGVGGPILFEQSIMGEGPMMDGAAHVRVEPVRERRALGEREAKHHQVDTYITGRRSCPGVILGGKCYQFFQGPKKAADAEFFCQSNFPQGHLASITSQQVHRQVMDLMLQQNGAYTRTWVGGLRYLETGRFIWLDGAHWTYEDFLAGEPNNTADVENCIELLAIGSGKFNDMPCWDLRSFICSHPI
ncbi:involucrin [Osmerus eperlanus]|uniref:involucrin n=1 Tax=Osmerus eperlanus TaxID=29151 RepID=UPI002E1501A8